MSHLGFQVAFSILWGKKEVKMPKKVCYVGVRLTQAEKERLERLAEATNSSKSRVLAQLLALAETGRWMEVVLSSQQEPKEVGDHAA